MNIIESNLQFKGNMTYGNVPIMIVGHHAESSHCTIEDIHQWHLNNGWAGCGYHFLVRKDGSVYRGRPENATGAHCPGANDKSIGVCAEGSYMTETMPDVQKQAIIDLCKYIISKYGIKQLYGHKELYSTDCPGTNYPLADIKAKAFLKEDVSPNGYRVITGVFGTKQDAVNFSNKLKSQGTTAYVVDANILK
jgi:N-acetyl-anhydromuramyl-L-alanine amidase AmpD